MWIPCGFHVESMWSPCGVLWGPVGSTSHPTKKKKLCGLHVDSTWSPVEFMWSRGVHKESMGQGKVHHLPNNMVYAIYDDVRLSVGGRYRNNTIVADYSCLNLP